MFRLHLDPDAQGASGGGSSLVFRLADLIRSGVSLPPISGGGEDDPAETSPPAPTPTPAPTATDPSEGFRKLLEKHQNDAARVAEKLYDENHTHRATIRDLKAKVPQEGSLVLNADQAKAWAAYLELGKPEEIGTIKAEHGQYATERQAAAREKFHGEIAEAHGYKPAVLSRLINQDNLDVELEDANVNGKTVKRAIVKDGDKRTPLPDYVKTHWDDFEGALKKSPDSKPIGTPRTGAVPTRTDSVPPPPRPSLVR